MKTYDLYSAKKSNLDFVRGQVEVALKIVLEERNSTYQGGVYYRCGDKNSEHFVLKNNLDPFDGDVAEQAFPNSSVLLYVNATEHSSELFNKLENDFVLLRHEDFE